MVLYLITHARTIVKPKMKNCHLHNGNVQNSEIIANDYGVQTFNFRPESETSTAKQIQQNVGMYVWGWIVSLNK